MGIANAPEIDRIKLTFDMPAGMRIIDEENGDEHTTYFELEIFFRQLVLFGFAFGWFIGLCLGRHWYKRNLWLDLK